MQALQSPTLLQLNLLGFVLVALPLVVAIVTAIAQVDGFARDSRQALVTVQKNTSTSRALAERVTELERTARLYQALDDSTYDDIYKTHRGEVLSMFAALGAGNRDARLRKQIEVATKSERQTHRLVARIDTDTNAADLGTAFGQLRTDVLAILQEQNAIARDLANAIPEQASQLQRLLFSQALLVIPLSLGLAVLFVILISRPMKQLNQGIHALGQGALTEPILVSGTKDLRALGRRLEWLRGRLVALEAQKVQFLRNVSHELKTPLTNIREGAELLQDPIACDNNREQQSISSIVRDNSIRLQKMIEELLHFGTEGDLSEPPHRLEPVALHRLAQDALDKQALSLSAKSIALNTDLVSANVLGNPKRIEIILDNLISNAIKFTPPQGEITVRMTANQTLAFLDVNDSGPGVATQDQPHLFDWFFKGVQPTDSIVSGTGIGLAMAQEYAQQQGGCVRLLQSAKGACFRLTLEIAT